MTCLWYSHAPFIQATKTPQEIKGNIQAISDLLTVSSHIWLGAVLTETWQNMRITFGKMRSDFVLRISELKIPNSNNIIFLFLFILPPLYICSHLIFYLRLPQLLSRLLPCKCLTPHSAWQKWGPSPEEWPADISGLQHLQAGIILISPLSHFSTGLLASLEMKTNSLKAVTHAAGACCRQEKLALF